MGLLSQFSSKAEIHRQQTARRFDDFLASYLSSIKDAGEAGDDEKSAITLVARSPESHVAQAVKRHGEALARSGCELKVIFSSFDPVDSFMSFIDNISQIAAGGDIQGAVLWVRNSSLLEAHEQLVLGRHMVWTGDAMRRSGDIRFGLDMFAENDCSTTRQAIDNFHGLWKMCEMAPRSRFCNEPSPAAHNMPMAIRLEGIKEQANPLPAGMMVTRH